MNKFERIIYNLVKRKPAIKFFLRDSYQALFDLLPVKRVVSAYPIMTREGFFFGFHDHTPFSVENNYLLANRHSVGLRMPLKDDILEIGYFDGDNYSQWHKVGTTKAWNWHQGCKLQWIGSTFRLIYNDVALGRYISRIYDIETGETIEIPHAISTISPNGRWAIGYSFERVERYMPGYGYVHETNEPQLDKRIPNQSWLYLVNLKTGEKKQLLNIEEIAAIKPETGSQEMWHYFSHALFCPSSERVAFLHRWVPNDTRALRSRMFTCDLNGENLHLFPTKEMVSHIGWRNREEIAAYCRLPDGRDRYVLFKDLSSAKGMVLGEDVFSSDGHLSFSPDGRWMLTDTYPDRTRCSYLILFDLETGGRYNLAYLKSPKRFATPDPHHHWACNLHPRFDRSGRYICFDSTHSGIRSLCTIDLGEEGLVQHPESVKSKFIFGILCLIL